MIKTMEGDIFATSCGAIVIPVNCLGVMGAGLALECSRRFPGSSRVYRDLCATRTFRPGHIAIVSTQAEGKEIVFLATKDDWRYRSSLAWIESGVEMIAQEIGAGILGSIAIPAIGCGLGGLNWREVRPAIERSLGCFDVVVELYGPGQSR